MMHAAECADDIMSSPDTIYYRMGGEGKGGRGALKIVRHEYEEKRQLGEGGGGVAL